MKKKNICFAWWWTGWHVFPIQSLIAHLDKNYHQQIDTVYWAWSKKGLEYTQFHKNTPQYIKQVFINTYAGKFRRETRLLSILKNIRDVFVFFFGIIYAIRNLRRYKIDTIFCKGWFIALPTVLAGAILRIPIVVHESDVKPGITNRIASRFAKTTFTWFDRVFGKAQTVGQILSDDIATGQSTNPDIVKLQQTYNPNKTYMLIVGWSQGSKTLYQTIAHTIATNPKLVKSMVFMIVWGIANTDIRTLFADCDGIYVFDFVSQADMAALCALADMSLTRWGTTSLAEQKHYNIKMIIVPIPRTHDQAHNAHRYHKNHHDIVLDQKKPSFAATLDFIIQQHNHYKKKPYKKEKIQQSIVTTKDIISQAILS